MKTSIKIITVLFSLLLCLFIGTAIGSPEVGLALFAVDLLWAYHLYRNGIEKGSLYSACGVVSAAILYDCTTPLVGGTETTVYVTNRADITAMTKNGSNALIVEGITMAATKKFYKLEGATGQNGSSVQPKYAMVKIPYGRAWEHTIDAYSFKIDPATKKELEAWNQADMTVIVENKFRNGTTGNTAYEIYGADGGLQMEVLERDPNNKDTVGGFHLQFKTQETSREGHMPYTFFLTDYATTRALVLALL